MLGICSQRLCHPSNPWGSHVIFHRGHIRGGLKWRKERALNAQGHLTWGAWGDGGNQRSQGEEGSLKVDQGDSGELPWVWRRDSSRQGGSL